MGSKVLLDGLVQKFESYLKQLEKELLAYTDESKLWETPLPINNSAGNLALHLVGNLNHFIGHSIGKTDYIRDRDGEFSAQNIPIAAIVEDIRKCKAEIVPFLYKLEANQLVDTFPFDFGNDFRPNTTYFLLHILTHLSYHIGQNKLS